MKLAVGRVVYRHIEVLHSLCWEAFLLYLADLSHGHGRPANFLARDYKTLWGDALVERGRSRLAMWFLEETDADVLLTIDGDITFNVQQALGTAMWADERKAVVGGLYMTRSLQSFPAIAPLPDQPLLMAVGAPLTAVRYVNGGFMAVHRRVLEEMVRRPAECDLERVFMGNEAYWTFYAPYTANWGNGQTVRLSEDWAFCDRARRLGFDVLLDPRVRLGHVGEYEWKLEDLITRRPDPLALELEVKTGEGVPVLHVRKIEDRKA